MPQKRHTVDQIVAKLRKADVELGKGKKVPEVCKLLEITEQPYCRWRQQYGRVGIEGNLPLAERSGCQNTLHRQGQPLGKRLC